MFNTHVKPARELRNNYAEIAGLVRNNDRVIITNHGRGESVLIGIEEYADYENYMHQRYIDDALSAAMAQVANPDAPRFSIDEVRQEIREKYGI